MGFTIPFSSLGLASASTIGTTWRMAVILHDRDSQAGPIPVRPAALPVCSAPTVSLTPDYAYIVGSAAFGDPDGDPEWGSRYRWLVNGNPITDTLVAEGILLNFDGVATGANGETPTTAQNVAYTPGRWGQALALPVNGVLKYPRQYNLPLDEGTIEMWVALRADGNDPRYTNKSHYLFFYQSGGDDYTDRPEQGFANPLRGGIVNGEWQSAYGHKAYMGAWKAGEWHHLAFTYSASGNWMRFYVDGVLTADTNKDHYWPPDADGAEFSVGGAPWWSNVAGPEFHRETYAQIADALRGWARRFVISIVARHRTRWDVNKFCALSVVCNRFCALAHDQRRIQNLAYARRIRVLNAGEQVLHSLLI